MYVNGSFEGKYIGEFLNGRFSGRGVIYNKDNKVIFDGNFLNGFKNGYGEYWSVRGELIFKGEYLNSKYGDKIDEDD